MGRSSMRIGRLIPSLSSQDEEDGFINYFEVLGVGRDATRAEIDAARKRMVLQHHPDRNQGNEVEARRRFDLVIYAHTVLTDEDDRLSHKVEVEIELMRKAREARGVAARTSIVQSFPDVTFAEREDTTRATYTSSSHPRTLGTKSDLAFHLFRRYMKKTGAQAVNISSLYPSWLDAYTCNPTAQRESKHQEAINKAALRQSLQKLVKFNYIHRINDGVYAISRS